LSDAVLLFIALSIALLLPLALGPASLPPFTICLFHRLTGLDCPGCGLTRAFLSAGRGHWSEAFALNPLGPLAWLWTVWLFLMNGVRLATGRPAPRIGIRPFGAGAVLLLLVWIVRVVSGKLS
jgi:hypothetical protein